MSSNDPQHPSMAGDPNPDPTDVRGRRIGAYFIDFAVLLIPSIFITFFFLEKRADAATCDDINANLELCFAIGDDIFAATDGRVVAMQFFTALLGIAYFVFLQGSSGWTVGKRLVGIRVVNESGAVCGIPKAFVRYLPLLVPALIPGAGWLLGGLIAIVEFILILSHKRHQRMGDLMAKTFVVRQDAVGAPVPYR